MGIRDQEGGYLLAIRIYQNSTKLDMRKRGLTTLNHYVAECRRALKSGQGPRTVHRRRRVSPRQAAILLTQKEAQINDRDKPYRDQLLQEVPWATELQGMCQSFHHLVETHDSA